MASRLQTTSGEFPANSTTKHLRMSLKLPNQWQMPSTAKYFSTYTSVVEYGGLVHPGARAWFYPRTKATIWNRLSPSTIYAEIWYADERVASAELLARGLTLTVYNPEGWRQSPKIAVATRFAHKIGVNGVLYHWSSKLGVRTRLNYSENLPPAKACISMTYASKRLLPYIMIDGERVEVPSHWKKRGQRRRFLSSLGGSESGGLNLAQHLTQQPLRFEPLTHSAFLLAPPDELDPLTGRRMTPLNPSPSNTVAL
jgi:hypothetical protein